MWNGGLEKLGGFNSISSIASLNVTGNNLMNDCCVLLNLGAAANNVSISGNGSNCGSLVSAALACGASFCGSSGYTTNITTQSEVDALAGCTDFFGTKSG